MFMKLNSSTFKVQQSYTVKRQDLFFNSKGVACGQYCQALFKMIFESK